MYLHTMHDIPTLKDHVFSFHIGKNQIENSNMQFPIVICSLYHYCILALVIHIQFIPTHSTKRTQISSFLN